MIGGGIIPFSVVVCLILERDNKEIVWAEVSFFFVSSFTVVELCEKESLIVVEKASKQARTAGWLAGQERGGSFSSLVYDDACLELVNVSISTRDWKAQRNEEGVNEGR